MRRLLVAGALASAAALASCSNLPAPAPAAGGGAAAPTAAAPAAAIPAARKATFDVRHELAVTLPDGAKRVRVWFVLPQDDPSQDVKDLKIEAPYPTRVTKDSENNKVLYLEAEGPKEKQFSVLETFRITRREVKSDADPAKTHALGDNERASLARYLAPNQNVPIDDRIRELARTIVGDEKNPVLAAKKLYEWELDNVDYWVKDPKNKKASPVGSTTYCLENHTGNCTDFHSLWLSLARASGIPARLIYGSFFKKELDGQDVDQSYHCWPQFYAPGLGWVSHDVAIADIFRAPFPVTPDNEQLVRRTTADGYAGPDPAKVAYYFGNLDERRVTWSSGRDLVLDPKPEASAALNALPKAYVEVDGRPLPEKTGWIRKLTYHEVHEG
ncbi:MAG: transglutaminase domain-containing protein [Planctomycetes bacterium]|nr:transglutaminase domain-containing protein [Planctomycetota bacterium]